MKLLENKIEKIITFVSADIKSAISNFFKEILLKKVVEYAIIICLAIYLLSLSFDHLPTWTKNLVHLHSQSEYTQVKNENIKEQKDISIRDVRLFKDSIKIDSLSKHTDSLKIISRKNEIFIESPGNSIRQIDSLLNKSGDL